MTRSEWLALASDFHAEAHALIGLSRWGLAYYIAGYAVECALKACVVKRVAAEPEVVFIVPGYSNLIRTHDLDKLVGLAGLKASLDTECAANPLFAANWDVVKVWSEESRYTREGQAAAEGIVAAISGKDGMYPWAALRGS